MRMRLRDNSSQCHVCSLFFFRSFLRREQKIVSICVCVWTSAHSSNSGHLKHWLFCVHCPSHTSSWCNSGCWLLLNYVWYQASFKWNIDVLLQRMETEWKREGGLVSMSPPYLPSAGIRSCGRATWNYATCWPTAPRSGRSTSRRWHRERWVKENKTAFDMYFFVSFHTHNLSVEGAFSGSACPGDMKGAAATLALLLSLQK